MNYIQQDLYRYGGLKGSKGFLKGLKIPGFRYMYLFRLATKYKSFIRIVVIKVLLRRYSFKYGIQIPVGTQVRGGDFI